ncbi:uncharacterized protein LOC124115892 [Haliotis rufescens]|uniref:uncharacterized protein LOC124115892 n=1 Tax=Haliotis rufescens TaxID=6454 RepID=UPI00201F90ED|nr:uncharacterized protein LOC124115892 [Haliotis rufescens]
MDGLLSELHGHRRRTREFHRAMQVVERLNACINAIIRRYNMNHGNINSAYLYALRLRLATIEGVRSLFLEYARSKMHDSGWQQDGDGVTSEEEQDPSAEEEEPEESFEEVAVDQHQDEEKDEDEDDELCNDTDRSTSEALVDDVGVEKRFATFSTYSVPDFSAIQANQSLREVRHLEDQIGNVVISDEGETTFEDLSDDEMDFVTAQVITHQCRM